MKRKLRKLGGLGLVLVVLVLFMGLLAIASESPEGAMAGATALIALGTVYTEGNYLGDFLLQEEEKNASRDEVTVLSGENLTVGAVIGKIIKALGTTTADGGNTGNGTVSGEALGAKAKLGNYILECIAVAADAGTFKVISPDGDALPDAEVGTAYTNDQINFTINDGATDFALGDKFTIPVEAGSGKVKELDTSGVDGSQNAAGILVADVDASAADVQGVAVVRNAIAIDSGLGWPDGISADEKAAALAELEAKHITVRKGV
jgi:hypothetical protein